MVKEESLTLDECMEMKLVKIRKLNWQPKAYLKLHLGGDGFYGPWGDLYDEPTQSIIGVESPQSVLLVGDDSDDWEEYPNNARKSV